METTWILVNYSRKQLMPFASGITGPILRAEITTGALKPSKEKHRKKYDRDVSVLI